MADSQDIIGIVKELEADYVANWGWDTAKLVTLLSSLTIR